MKIDYFLGIDGCRGGWVVAALDAALSLFFFLTLEEAREKIKDSEFTLIDMPMGLKSEGKGERKCDVEARKFLKKRKMSIFPMASRQAVYSSNYEEANKVNREILGKGLSKQSYNLFPKIREVDSFIEKNTLILNRICEGHPELSFARLNRSEMVYSKKTQEGYDERLTLIKRSIPHAEEVISHFRSLYKTTTLVKDDILDAVILALAATSKTHNNYKIVPPEEEIDIRGVSMKIFIPFSEEISFPSDVNSDII